MADEHYDKDRICDACCDGCSDIEAFIYANTPPDYGDLSKLNLYGLVTYDMTTLKIHETGKYEIDMATDTSGWRIVDQDRIDKMVANGIKEVMNKDRMITPVANLRPGDRIWLAVWPF